MLLSAVRSAVVICRTVMMSGCYRFLEVGSLNALRVACCCTLCSNLARRPRTPSHEQTVLNTRLPEGDSSSKYFLHLDCRYKLCNCFASKPKQFHPFGTLTNISSSAHSKIENFGAVCGGAKCDRNSVSLYCCLTPGWILWTSVFVTILQKPVRWRCVLKSFARFTKERRTLCVWLYGRQDEDV